MSVANSLPISSQHPPAGPAASTAGATGGSTASGLRLGSTQKSWLTLNRIGRRALRTLIISAHPPSASPNCCGDRSAIMSIAVAVFRGTLDTASELFHVRTRTRKTSDAFRKEPGLYLLRGSRTGLTQCTVDFAVHTTADTHLLQK